MAHELHEFISREEISNTVRRLGRELSLDYASTLKPNESLKVIVILKGAILFASDLIRELKVPVRLDMIRLASYGSGSESSGKIHMLKDLEQTPKDEHVLILDEIIDTGRTLSFLIQKLRSAGAKSVKTCTLLNKASRRQVIVNVDYIGKEIEDKFVVGYGLDFNEDYRNLPAIHYIKT